MIQAEMEKFVALLKAARESGKPLRSDAATMGAALIRNGWPAADAFGEAQHLSEEYDYEDRCV